MKKVKEVKEGEEIFLENSVDLHGKVKPIKCENCNSMFILIRICDMPEQSGEHHYEPYQDKSEYISCPYCPRPGDKVMVCNTPASRGLGIAYKEGIILSENKEGRVSVLIIDEDDCKFGPYELGIHEVMKK